MKDPIVLPINEVVARLHGFDAIIDARSPGEFALDHLPGALNAPVLDDAQRAQVGTINAEQGAFEAKRLGAALVSHNIGELLQTRFAHCDRDWKPLVYCWRGGQRSGSLATVMARIGWRTTLIEGGYRAFRRQVISDLQALSPTLNLIVVGGRTGCAKSRLLERLQQHGEQVLDLERLARHRGSVLGALPDYAQPAQKRFETLLWDAVRHLDPARPIYVESESRKIGQCQVPEALIESIRARPVIIVDAPVPVRSQFLLDEYDHFRAQAPHLIGLLDRLTPLHGSQRVEEWTALIEADRWQELVERLLIEHYDPAYDRSIRRNFAALDAAPRVHLSGTTPEALELAVCEIIDVTSALSTPASSGESAY
jgi:tRNA 2-selenouridine synthase